METNKQAEIVHEVLIGIVKGVMSAREEAAKYGALVAPVSKRIEVEFQIHIPAGSYAHFTIPVSIPAQRTEIDETEEKPVTPDTKISDTDLPTRIKNGLRVNDIESVRELLAVTNITDLLSIRHLGTASIWKIEEFLSRHGLSPKWANKEEIKIK
jgi:DNA-directed RNA polymerase alpha subunit